MEKKTLKITQHSPHTGVTEKILSKDVVSVQVPENTTLVIRHTDGTEEMMDAPRYAITVIWLE